MVMTWPFMFNAFSNSGIAVISLDLSSTRTSPMQKPLSSTALTILLAFWVPVALPRWVLPSIPRACLKTQNHCAISTKQAQKQDKQSLKMILLIYRNEWQLVEIAWFFERSTHPCFLILQGLLLLWCLPYIGACLNKLHISEVPVFI